jgi:hypothetical protein
MLRSTWLFVFLCVIVAGTLVSCSGGGHNPAVDPGPAVHVAGYYEGASNDVAAYWLRTAAGEADLHASSDAQALAIFVYGADVYVAGYYKNADGKLAAAYWKNGVVTDLYSDSDTNATATGITFDGTDVYVSGYYYTTTPGGPSGDAKACYWVNDDTGRVELHPTADYSEALGIAASPGTVYVAGFYNNGTNDVACYWQNDGSLVKRDLYSANYARANAIVFDGTDVYAAGNYLSGVLKACTWKNNAAGITTLGDGNATSIFVSGTDIYTAGYYQNATPNNVAVYWRNTSQVKLFESTTPLQPGAGLSIFVYNGDVYVAGYSYSTGVRACYWKNSSANRTILYPDSVSSAQGVFVTD